jgi:hypothetical protein
LEHEVAAFPAACTAPLLRGGTPDDAHVAADVDQIGTA